VGLLVPVSVVLGWVWDGLAHDSLLILHSILIFGGFGILSLVLVPTVFLPIAAVQNYLSERERRTKK
jgi:hypothetical protein